MRRSSYSDQSQNNEHNSILLGFYYDRTGTGLLYEASARPAGDDPLRTHSLRSYGQLLETSRLLASQGALSAQLASLALRPPSAVRGSRSSRCNPSQLRIAGIS